MTIFVENDLQITLPDGIVFRKFDDEKTHGLSHCMKAVDFIVELDESVLFIEFKDPEHPNSTLKDSNTFIKKFLSGQIDADLKTKYRDSWLYEWAQNRTQKPIYYLVLIGASWLSDAELLDRTDSLKRQLPVISPSGQPWQKNFITDCAVFNLDTWNKTFANLPVSRISHENFSINL